MDFWNDELTSKSWELLQGLSGFGFVLIGGWAAWLWTRTHKSKDIDLVLEDINELDFLKMNYDLRKNDSLKKYEIKIGEIDIDIYVPFYSRLVIPADELPRYSAKIQAFKVARPEALLVLKQGAELDRQFSVKGQKDRIDIMALLLFTGVDFSLYRNLLQKHRLAGYEARLKSIINNFDGLKYIGLNPREYKLKKGELLEAIRKKA